ncbi:MAG: hypothetical protein HDQ97_18140 [Lachnospiraceae bacterium]|nr:hypothetical protein [Lachnospiraceae bacterium]
MAITGVTDYTNTYAADRTNGSSGASGNMQDYLKGLKEKYPDVNITVADFKNGKQEDAYMLGSRGYNNVAISASIVEKMSKDPAAAVKYEKVISDMTGNADRIEKFAKENNDEILGAGVVIDKNGKVSYWMVGRSKDKIENPGTVYKQKVQKQIEEKRAKKKEEEALKKKRLEKAETLEKLLEKAGNGVSENEPAADVKIKETGKGEQIDLSV